MDGEERKALLYSTMLTDKFGWNDEVGKSPFCNHHNKDWFRQE